MTLKGSPSTEALCLQNAILREGFQAITTSIATLDDACVLKVCYLHGKYTFQMLQEGYRLLVLIRQLWRHESVTLYLVFESYSAEIHSLGGDLSFFHQCIVAQEREKLHEYIRLTLECIWLTAHLPTSARIIPVTLISGIDVAGGGVEGMLATYFVFATEKARFSLPEGQFSLPPSSGGVICIGRSAIDPEFADILLTHGGAKNSPSSLSLSAITLHEQGLIYRVIPSDLDPHVELENWITIAECIDHNLRWMYAYVSSHFLFPNQLFQVLLHKCSIWVDDAMKLDFASLRKMKALARLQERKIRNLSL